MSTEMDIIRLNEFCDSVLDLRHAKLSDEYFYQSLPLCVIDSVYSIGVKYEGTRRTVKKYCEYYGLQKIRFNREAIPLTEDQESIEHFTEKMVSGGIAFFAVDVFKNRQRTSTRNGILKSEAVLRFSKTLQKYNVNYLQDVPVAVNNVEFENDIKEIPGQRSGISLKYFCMLAGSKDLIKPDRWIKKFIKDAIEKQVNDQESQRILSGACEKLKIKYPHLTPRLLDNEIWKYQQNKKTKNESKRLYQNKNCGKFVGTSYNQHLPFTGGCERKIAGRIVCPDTDRLEITINKNQDHMLPLKYKYRVAITVLIGGVAYEAGVRITGQGIPWICPNLHNLQGQKVRLADALRKSGFEKGQKVFLTECGVKTFKIDHNK